MQCQRSAKYSLLLLALGLQPCDRRLGAGRRGLRRIDLALGFRAYLCAALFSQGCGDRSQLAHKGRASGSDGLGQLDDLLLTRFLSEDGARARATRKSL